MANYVVKALALNLRSADDPEQKNVIATLRQGTVVRKLADAGRPGWFEVQVDLGGRQLHGFLNGSAAFLTHAKPGATSDAPAGPLPPADLGTSSSARRDRDGSRAHRLGEAGLPARPSTHPQGPAAGILRVLDWCAVEKPGHLRWWPAGRETYCNIYAYDVCTLSGTYLPRVWWTGEAIALLRAGERVPVVYGRSVSELAANYLYNWLEQYGEGFGWRRHYTTDEVQEAANAGRLGLICAQHRNLNSSGHIQIVAPEHGEQRARRVGGVVTQPLQSNAGSSNFRYGHLGSSWWQGPNFAAYGFWSAEEG